MSKIKRIDEIVNSGKKEGILTLPIIHTDPKTKVETDLKITATVIQKMKTNNSKTLVEVISFTGTQGYFDETSPYSIKRINQLCGGWVDNSKIEWLVVYDEREELINQILDNNI